MASTVSLKLYKRPLSTVGSISSVPFWRRQGALFQILLDGQEVGFVFLDVVDKTLIVRELFGIATGFTVKSLFEALPKYAKANGLEEIEFTTFRKGMTYLAKKNGFEVIEVILRKAL